MRLLHPVAASCSLFFASALALGAPAARIAVDAARRDPPISRRLFGKFTEHLGRNVYLGAWAQVAANPEFASASRWKGRDGMFYHGRRGASEDQRHLERAVQRGFAPHWFAEGDAQVLGQEAHSLKSSAANVGARTLSEVHRALEHCARGGRMAEARSLLAPLQREHARAVAGLRAWMKAAT